MKIVRVGQEQLELRGTPGAGFAAMGMLVCPIIIGGCAFFIWHGVKAASGSWARIDVIVPGIAACGIGTMWMFCWALLLLNREMLVIDRVTGEVRHRVWWRVFGRERTKTYPLDRVVGVSLEKQEKRGAGGKGWTTVTQTRLLIDKPRRAIVMATSESGWAREVEPTAREVAAWLGVEVRKMGDS